MIRLQALSGTRVGEVFTTGRLPCRVGREASADWRLTDPGIWEGHLGIGWEPEGLMLQAHPEAIVALNGQAVERAKLRNGDVLELGGVRLRFSLSETRQRTFRLRELLTWAGIFLLCVGQLLLVYFLLP